MPDISNIFSPEDPGFLRTVAQVWGVEELDTNFEELLFHLKTLIGNNETMEEVFSTLPELAIQALYVLAANGGKMPWADFSHKYGSIREMGAGRRDRLHPELNPETVSEILFYKGFLGRLFLDEKPEPREFVFIPDEILVGIRKVDPGIANLPGQPIQLNTIHDFQLANDSLLQDICTLVTALRLGIPKEEIRILPLEAEEKFVHVMLKECGMVSEQDIVKSDPVKEFLELPRSKAIYKLANIWRNSPDLHDLNMVEGLIFERNCSNDPLSVKELVLEVLGQISPNTWWDLKSFVDYFHSHHPNFLRPSGDFNSWFVREKETGQYLQGFDAWNKIEGRLLEFLVTKPLHWLGFLDLGFSSPKGEPSSFRLSRWWKVLSLSQAPSFSDPAPEDVFITSRGKITVPLSSPLSVRYLIGRFSKLVDKNPHAYSYQVTHESLKIAKKQGLKTSQFVKIIQSHSSSPFPPTLLKALQNWESVGPQAHFKDLKIIRFSNSNIVSILVKSKAAKYIKESLNPTTIAYDPGGEKIIKSVLLEAGYFSEDEMEKEV